MQRRKGLADTALPPGAFVPVTGKFWPGLQMGYDLETTRASIGAGSNRK